MVTHMSQNTCGVLHEVPLAWIQVNLVKDMQHQHQTVTFFAQKLKVFNGRLYFKDHAPSPLYLNTYESSNKSFYRESCYRELIIHI